MTNFVLIKLSIPRISFRRKKGNSRFLNLKSIMLIMLFKKKKPGISALPFGEKRK